MFSHKVTRAFLAVMLVLLSVQAPAPLYAQTSFLNLPQPGTMVDLSPAHAPVLLKGIKLDPENPLRFEFLLDQGQSEGEIKTEADRLIKYFLTCLTLPEEDLWVNLSPYEKDRMMAPSFGQTALGRDMLAQDYVLKQLTASLIYPEKELGKEFWSRVYSKTKEKYGDVDIPVNTFNKVWILADEARVFSNGDKAFTLDAKMKVMLEEDYLAKEKNNGKANTVTSDVIREIILPELEKEINFGTHFAPLRQMYHAFVLASWYKKNLKQSIVTQVYANKKKVGSLQPEQSLTPESIYQSYLQAYKKGVFNYIKDPDPTDLGSGAILLPRKYFSGGTQFKDRAIRVSPAQLTTVDRASIARDSKLTAVVADYFTPSLTSSVASPAMSTATPSKDVNDLGVADIDARELRELLNELSRDTEMVEFLQNNNRTRLRRFPLAGRFKKLSKRIAQLAQHPVVVKELGTYITVHHSPSENNKSILKFGIRPGSIANSIGFVGYDFTNPQSIAVKLSVVAFDVLQGLNNHGNVRIDSISAFVVDYNHPGIRRMKAWIRYELKLTLGSWFWIDLQWPFKQGPKPKAVVDLSVDLNYQSKLASLLDKYLNQKMFVNYERLRQVVVTYIWLKRYIRMMEGVVANAAMATQPSTSQAMAVKAARSSKQPIISKKVGDSKVRIISQDELLDALKQIVIDLPNKILRKAGEDIKGEMIEGDLMERQFSFSKFQLEVIAKRLGRVWDVNVIIMNVDKIEGDGKHRLTLKNATGVGISDKLKKVSPNFSIEFKGVNEDYYNLVLDQAMTAAERDERMEIAMRSLGHGPNLFNPSSHSIEISLSEIIESGFPLKEWKIRDVREKVGEFMDLYKGGSNRDRLILIPVMKDASEALRALIGDIRDYSATWREKDISKRKSLDLGLKRLDILWQELQSRVNMAYGVSSSDTFSIEQVVGKVEDYLGDLNKKSLLSNYAGFKGKASLIKKEGLEKAQVKGDWFHLNNTVLNLVKNAQEAGASDIKLEFAIVKGGLQIKVIDNGKGLDSDMHLSVNPDTRRQRIFDLNNTDKSGGTGLGTTEAWYAIKDMGGEIIARNRIDRVKGAEFIISLPIVNSKQRKGRYDLASFAQTHTPGGIAFKANDLKLKDEGASLGALSTKVIGLSPDMISQLMSSNFKGFTPIIREFKPIADPLGYLGLSL